jgi:hypothetical protein
MLTLGPKPLGSRLNRSLLTKAANGTGFDAAATAYIAAVEAADGQALETGVKTAINAFVVGCKADGIWNAIKASCILSGARTLSGALVPLAGTGPTNNNFVSGDYDRKTGLVGNGSTKYLNSNRSMQSDPANNQHVSIYLSTYATNTWLGGATNSIPTFYTDLESSGLYCGTAGSSVSIAASTTGFVGVSRNSDTAFLARTAAATSSSTSVYTSKTMAANYPVFAYWNGTTFSSYSAARLAFYSIGESLDLALLDARVTTLISAYAAALP